MAQRKARRTHNPEGTGSKPVTGIQPLLDRKVKSIIWIYPAWHRRLARKAHNLEVVGSKPTAGIQPLLDRKVKSIIWI